MQHLASILTLVLLSINVFVLIHGEILRFDTLLMGVFIYQIKHSVLQVEILVIFYLRVISKSVFPKKLITAHCVCVSVCTSCSVVSEHL